MVKLPPIFAFFLRSIFLRISSPKKKFMHSTILWEESRDSHLTKYLLVSIHYPFLNAAILL